MQLKEMWGVPSIRGFWNFEKKILHEISCESKHTELTENPPFMQPLWSKKQKFALISGNRISGNRVSRNYIIYTN